MSDPSRLLDGDVEAEKALLRAWMSRQPSEASRLKTLAAVGVGTALLAGGAGVSVAPKAAVVSASLVKWLAALGGVAAVGAVAGYVVVRAPSPEASVPIATPVVHPAPFATVQTPTPVAAPIMTAVAPPLPAAPPAPAVAPAPPKTASAVTLDEEVLAIDHARGALSAGDAAGALQAVDAYDARYPNGALAQESAEVRIEALFRAGKRAQAEKLAARFVAAHPNSPYVRVIRALSTGAPSPGP